MVKEIAQHNFYIIVAGKFGFKFCHQRRGNIDNGNICKTLLQQVLRFVGITTAGYQYTQVFIGKLVDIFFQRRRYFT